MCARAVRGQVRATGMRNVVWTNAVGFLRITANSSQWNTKLDVGQARPPPAPALMRAPQAAPHRRTRNHVLRERLAGVFFAAAWRADSRAAACRRTAGSVAGPC